MGVIRAARYGATLRKRYEAVYRKAKATYECPVCRRISVKRVRLGIWKCRKCGATFTGGAWTPKTVERK